VVASLPAGGLPGVDAAGQLTHEPLEADRQRRPHQVAAVDGVVGDEHHRRCSRPTASPSQVANCARHGFDSAPGTWPAANAVDLADVDDLGTVGDRRVERREVQLRQRRWRRAVDGRGRRG
jgi:hypothetical protein